MSMQIGIAGEPARKVAVSRHGAKATLWVDERPVECRAESVGEQLEVTVGERTERFWVVTHKDEVFIHAFGRAWTLSVRDMREAADEAASGADRALAPMPGTVIEVAVSPGQAVEAGTVLLTIESMKMQTDITAPRDGIVERIALREGETFQRGAVLATLAAEQED